MRSLLEQAGLASVFFYALVFLFKASGKRAAGQLTSFDLIVMISMAVVLQQSMLKDGWQHEFTFFLSLFAHHRIFNWACHRYPKFRYFTRPRPALIVKDGVTVSEVLRDEKISKDEVQAGLRKMGFDDITQVKKAYLEETGQISVIR